MKRLTTGLALGSGAARGWAHIGVIEALTAMNVRIDVVCGASNGALVAGIYAAGTLPELTAWLTQLGRLDVIRLLDPGLRGGGFIRGGRLMDALSPFMGDHEIGSLDRPFGAVATELRSGREVWLREGLLREAVRASIALPGLFTPVQWQGRWLTDGGLVNPVPVSLCRAMGADIVLAVNVNANLLQPRLNTRDYRRGEQHDRRSGRRAPDPAPVPAHGDAQSWVDKLKESLQIIDLRRQFEGFITNDEPAPEDGVPGLVEVIANAIDIMQNRITRSRMIGEPPDVVITPRVADIHLMDFHRAGEAIAAGRDAVGAVREEIERLCGAGGNGH